MAGSNRRIRRIRLVRAPKCSWLGSVVNVVVRSQTAMAALWDAAGAWPARRRRASPGGGETRATDDPPALVSTAEENGAPHEAHVQVTRACALPCPTCHIEPEIGGEHVPVAVLAERFQALAEAGVFHVALGGGEALSHPELAAVAEAAHAAGLSVGLTTSGVGDLDAARGFDQVNVSIDALGEGYSRVRGYSGEAVARAAICALVASGQPVGVNIVLDRESFPGLADTVAACVALGVRDVHLLRLKPAGRAGAVYLERRLTAEQGLAIWPALRGLLAAFPAVSFRVDCAMTPFLAAHGVDPARMRDVGWTGCHGGDALLAVDTAGSSAPCSFVEGPVDPAWRDGVRAEPCGSCAWGRVCRGGCHAVARFVRGALLVPDPECPLVIAHAGVSIQNSAK